MTAKFIQTVFLSFFIHFAYAQVSQNMSLLGNFNPSGYPSSGAQKFNDVWGYVDCSGNEYAILGGVGYYHFVDITVPTNPVEVTSIAGGNVTPWRDMKTYSKYAYGVCDNCSEGLSVFDLGNLPNSVTMVGQYTTSFSSAHNIFIDENSARLYAVGTNTQGNGVIVFDLAANPANPPEIARMALPGGYMHDLYVLGNIGYGNSGNNGLYVYDFTNLSNVVTLGSLTGYVPGGYNHAGWVTSNGQGYIFADETHNRDIKYCDISSLNNISITNTFRSELLAPGVTGSVAHNPYVRDNYAIISYYHDGLQIFDISNPANIIQTAWYDTYTAHTNYAGFRGNWGAYPFLPSGNILASDMYTGLYILDPTNITFTPITPPPPPTVTISANGPTSFCNGGSVVLSASFTGNSVQWYLDGAPIAGANNASFTATEGGNYTAETYNSACAATSSPLTVTIETAPDATLNVGNFNQICDNETLDIIAPPGAGSYIWTLNGNFYQQNTNIITVDQPGDYQVEVSNGDCSAWSIIASVVIENTPNVALNLNGTQEICDTETLTLFVDSGANSYQWTRNNIPYGSNTNSIIVSQSGNYQVMATNGNCTATSAIVSVNTLVAPDVTLNDEGPVQLCDGESAILEVPAGADSYTWYRNGSVVVGTQAIIDVFQSGTYHVEAANGNCTATSQTVVVNVSNTPDVNLSVPLQNELCDGEILQIAVPAGADSYSWYFNNTLQNAASGNSFLAENSGDYYVIAENNGCMATSQTVSLIVEAYPDVNLNVPAFNEICQGEDLLITVPNNAQNYQWYLNNQLLATNTNSIFASETGDYYVVANNGNCEATSQTIALMVQEIPDATLNTTGDRKSVV